VKENSKTFPIVGKNILGATWSWFRRADSSSRWPCPSLRPPQAKNTRATIKWHSHRQIRRLPLSAPDVVVTKHCRPA